MAGLGLPLRRDAASALCVQSVPWRSAFAYAHALRGAAFPWLLESVLESPRLGRFSFAGAEPYAVLRVRGARLEIECRRGVRPGLEPGVHREEGNAFLGLRSLLPAPPASIETDSRAAAAALPFVGGSVGYFGYELGEQVEPVRLAARDDLGLPDLVLLFVDRLLAVDHATRRAYACGLGFGERLEDARRAARRAARAVATEVRALPEAAASVPSQQTCGRRASVASRSPEGLKAFFDERSYGIAVEAVRGEIEAGRVYQANIAQRMDAPLARGGTSPSWDLYCALRDGNPAPFAAYLGLPEAAVCSSSPERFLSVAPDGRVESRPIKGTRPRGGSFDADRALAAALAGSAKDRAENLMIVDLVRNDLGRACEIGSVAVPELMSIERYATVFQMVSTVTGRLRAGCDALDVLQASFPPGSMTGAPKIAAMRLIDRLEPVRRGVYAGALGYLDVRGGLDLSVVIRSIVTTRGRAYLHAGGGIVADSEPRAEWAETLDKAAALLTAIRVQQAGVQRRPAPGPPSSVASPV